MRIMILKLKVKIKILLKGNNLTVPLHLQKPQIKGIDTIVDIG